MATHPSDGQCAHCHKTAWNTCAACEEVPGLVPNTKKTFYCSPRCQIAHWPTHKPLCKVLIDQKSLYQGGELIRRLWLVLRTSTFRSNLEVVQAATKPWITVWEHRVENGREHYPQPFRHYLFQNEKVKEAVLSDGAAGIATEHMRGITKLLLGESGICITFEETRTPIRPSRNVVSVHHRNENSPRYIYEPARYSRRTTQDSIVHESNVPPTTTSTSRGWQASQKAMSLSTTTSTLCGWPASQQIYALDMTNAQFNLYDTVIHWSDLRRIHDAISAIDQWGTHDERRYTLFTKHTIRERCLVEFNARRLDHLLRIFLERNDYTPATLLRLDRATFQAKATQLEEFTAKGLEMTAHVAKNCAELMVLWNEHEGNEEMRAAMMEKRTELAMQADACVPLLG